jgi:para-nitrobenzyl esterase
MQTLLPNGRPPWTREYVVQGKISEDCLSLNVWTPTRTGSQRPVLVWIHGGGFNEGSGSVPIYNGSALAGRNVVVVTINYRIGAFGFLAHPELTREAGNAVPANFGILDQIAALHWIQKNIASFGGNPANVTIAGQSAGSVAVHALVASPLARGLFSRAIAQSGLPDIIPLPTLAEAEKNGVAFASEKGVKTLAQLRALPADRFVTAAATPGGLRFVMVVDGKLLPATPQEMMAKGDFNDVPMIVGQNADEASAFPEYGSGDPEAFKSFMTRSFGEQASVFAHFYPADSEETRARSAKEVSRDRGVAMICLWSLDHHAQRRSPVFAYYYSHTEPGEESARFGAFHSSEIPYALSTLDAAPERNFTLADRQISLVVSGYWVNFIQHGDPNGAGLPNWAPVSADKPTMIEIGDQTAGRPFLTKERLDAYRAFVAQGGKLSMF